MQSMTGYGRASLARDGREITLEVKSVNHRFLDISFRMPRTFAFAEDPLRKGIGRFAQRGHFDVYVSYDNRREDSRQVEVDIGLVKAYLSALDTLLLQIRGMEQGFSLKDYASLPDVLRVTQQEDDREVIQDMLGEVLEAAMGQLCAMRRAEGEFLTRDMEQKLSALEAHRGTIQAKAPQVVAAYREKLSARVQELLETPVDAQRLAQEVVIFADRATIDEELVRLLSHIGQMREAFRSTEAVGRRLDFLVQELNREVNTIGSKSQDPEISARVVEMKGIVEKLREQVQNVE